MYCIKVKCKLWNKTTRTCGEGLKHALDEICSIEHKIWWHNRKIGELEKEVQNIKDNQ